MCLVCSFSSGVMADTQVEKDEWEQSLAVYLWGAGISGQTARGTGVDVDFKDILDNLNFAAMGAYHARKGKWSVLADVIYMDIGNDKRFELQPPIGSGTLPATVSADIASWVVQFGGGYNLYDDGEGTRTDVTFGARFLDLSTEILVDFDLSIPDAEIDIPLSQSAKNWDAIIGMRGVVSLGDRWFMPWGANIGTGDSDFTWQAMAGVGFKASSWADIALTYRYLKWEFDAGMLDDLSISGPQLGVIFRF